MSSQNRPQPSFKRTGKTLVDEMISFGPDTPVNMEQECDKRIRRLVKKLRDLSRRIDHISSKNG